MRRTEKRRSIGPQRGTGSSTPVSTAWPLPALGIPNPVITQNTQPGSDWVSEPELFPTLLLWTEWDHVCVCDRRFCRVYSPPFSPEARKKSSFVPVALTSLSLAQKRNKKRSKLADTLWPLQTNKALGTFFLWFLSLNLTSSGCRKGKPRSCYAEKRRHLVFPPLLLEIYPFSTLFDRHVLAS